VKEHRQKQEAERLRLEAQIREQNDARDRDLAMRRNIVEAQAPQDGGMELDH